MQLLHGDPGVLISIALMMLLVMIGFSMFVEFGVLGKTGVTLSAVFLANAISIVAGIVLLFGVEELFPIGGSRRSEVALLCCNILFTIFIEWCFYRWKFQTIPARTLIYKTFIANLISWSVIIFLVYLFGWNS